VPAAAAPRATEPAVPAAKKKLSYKEQRELDELPARIEALENEQARLAGEIGGTALYTETPQRIAEVTARHAAIEDELMLLLERWEALSNR
jgi:ATP-binding cassette subfamily F protein uup